MIIDLILDRKYGQPYKPRTFYINVLQYGITWPEIAHPIASALDGGSEQDVKNALNRYIIEEKYNRDIIKYINSVNWL